MQRIIINLLIVASLLLGCKGAENSNGQKLKNAPHWVTKHPQSYDYYTGVAVVSKDNLGYRELAKKKALENLASEISVQISGESVLKTLENGDNFSQEYNQEITVKSAEALEGFEIVDSYETKDQYWVYYRLSKQKYESIKREKLNKALNIGKEFFLKSKQNHKQGNYYESYVLGIKALEAVSDYLDQPLKTQIEDKEVYFATEVMSYLQDLTNELNIKPSAEMINVVLGQGLSEDKIYFRVFTEEFGTVANIPVNIRYNAIFFRSYELSTNAQGIAGISIEKINQNKERQSVVGEINFNKIVDSQTNDRIVKKLLSYNASKTATINLQVRAPKIFIVSQEKSYGASIKSKLTPSVKQALISKGFKIAMHWREADYVLTINTNTNGSSSSRGMFNCQLTGHVDVKTTDTNETVFTETLMPQNGLQLNKSKAADDVYSKADSYLKRIVIPKLANEFFSF